MEPDMPQFSSAYPVPDRVVEGIDRARRQIASSGARWTGQERVEIALASRAAGEGADFSATALDPVTAAMAATVGTDAHSLSEASIDSFVAETGRDIESYVELVGVVARTAAIDTAMVGAGSTPVEFPAGDTAAPSGQTESRARKRSAFVPTVGPAGATSALSAVAIEDRAQEDLHGALYLTYYEMGDMRIHKGLDRWQLELVAARTSLINHCLF